MNMADSPGMTRFETREAYDPSHRDRTRRHTGMGQLGDELPSRLISQLVFAGGRYGTTVFLIVGGVQASLTMPRLVSAEPVSRMPALNGFLLAAPLIGCMAYSAAAIVALPSGFALVSALGYRPSQDKLAGACGGATGGVIALCLWLPFLDFDVSTWSRVLSVVALYSAGAGAILYGWVAGLVASLNAVRRRRRGRLASAPFRLTLRSLLAIMIPLSIALASLRAADSFRVEVLSEIGLAVATLCVAYWPSGWLVNRWADRRLRRRREARLAAGRST